MTTADAVVIGAGIIGALCARELARAGLSVQVVDAGAVGSGTTGACEGNILVSDKAPGPELSLALESNRLWHAIAADLGPEIELDPKGGLVVATGADEARALIDFARAQQEAGVDTEVLDASATLRCEPELRPDLSTAIRYDQDMQVMPSLAAAAALRDARRHGARVQTGSAVIAIDRTGDRVSAVRCRDLIVHTPVVVNAAGAGADTVAALAGSALPVQPRRGFILVTEPIPVPIRHKVYDAAYVSNVSSSEAGLATSTVVESTRSGTVLIGASRERVGYDTSVRYDVLGLLAHQAIALFPFLSTVRAMRSYCGFRPYCPDHLPVISADPSVPGLFHAAGHEGAGIGLAPATAAMIGQLVTGRDGPLDPAPFALDRAGLRSAVA